MQDVLMWVKRAKLHKASVQPEFSASTKMLLENYLNAETNKYNPIMRNPVTNNDKQTICDAQLHCGT